VGRWTDILKLFLSFETKVEVQPQPPHPLYLKNIMIQMCKDNQNIEKPVNKPTTA
jgi:hypothetical protein